MNTSPEIRQKVKELIEEIKNKINKENLIKAGTEIEQNMTRELQKRLESRFVQLRQEFNEIDANQDSFLSIDELYNFFSSKNALVKKEDIISLFDLNNRSHYSKISLNDFIYLYILLEEKLRLKKEDLNILKNNLIRKNEKYQAKLKEYEKEDFYSQGLSKQNELNIGIIKIKDLQNLRQFKIVLNLMNKSGQILDEKETEVKFGSNPDIQEVFSFRVLDVECYVKCFLSDVDSLINEGHGYFIINLNDYLDQMKKEKWCNIIGEENKAQVLVSCSFTYNNKKKYTDLINKVSQQLDKLNQMIFQIENLMEKINEPYGLLYFNKIKEIHDKKILNDEELVNDLSFSRISIFSSQKFESPNKFRISEYDNKKDNEALDVIREEGGEGMNSNLLKNEIKSTEGYLPDNFNQYFPKNSLLGK